MKKEEKLKFEKFTLKEFTKAMEWLGYKVRGCGCNHYYILNNRNKDIGIGLFEWSSGDVVLESEKQFGDYGGVIYFQFSACDLEISEGMVSLVAKHNNNVFISFYNHAEKHKNKPYPIIK